MFTRPLTIWLAIVHFNIDSHLLHVTAECWTLFIPQSLFFHIFRFAKFNSNANAQQTTMASRYRLQHQSEQEWAARYGVSVCAENSENTRNKITNDNGHYIVNFVLDIRQSIFLVQARERMSSNSMDAGCSHWKWICQPEICQMVIIYQNNIVSLTFSIYLYAFVRSYSARIRCPVSVGRVSFVRFWAKMPLRLVLWVAFFVWIFGFHILFFCRWFLHGRCIQRRLSLRAVACVCSAAKKKSQQQ